MSRGGCSRPESSWWNRSCFDSSWISVANTLL
eukprot:gene23842-biopygen9667